MNDSGMFLALALAVTLLVFWRYVLLLVALSLLALVIYGAMTLASPPDGRQAFVVPTAVEMR